MRRKKSDRYTKKNLSKPLTEEELRYYISLLNKEKEEGKLATGEIYKFRDNYYFIPKSNV